MGRHAPADIHLRREQPGDETQVAAIVEGAFRERRIADLVATLRSSPDGVDGLGFVAENGRALVGHVLFSRALLDAPRRLVDVLVLSPVSVAPEHQGRGIGSSLVRYALSQLAGRQEPLVFVEGSPAFYRRFGFEAAEPLGFRRPSLRIPEPAFQVIRQPSYEGWMTGTLVYSRVFWDLDCVGLRDDVG